MVFLNSALLAALAAAFIPLAIHLLGRRKRRRVRFSAIAFLEQVRREHFRRMRFRNWLLLAVRTLLIAFLVLAFARPAMRHAAAVLSGGGNAAMVVVLDDGPSMGYSGAYGRRFDWAREQVSDIAQLTQPGDHAMLIRTSRPDLVYSLDARIPESLSGPAAWSGDGVEALTHAAELLNRATAPNAELYILTDRAGPPWHDLHPIKWPSAVAPFVMSPPVEQTENLAVDSVSGGGEMVRVGQELSIEAIIRNTGEQPVENALAGLWLDGRRVQQQTISLAAGERQSVSFSTTLRTKGWVAGRVEIADDPMPGDNARWFALRVPDYTRLLIVGNDTASRRRIESLFQNPDLTEAYRVSVIAPQDITLDSFRDADVILLNEDTNLPDRTIEWLAEVLQNGTGLIAILGPQSDIPFANRHIMPLIGSTRLTGSRSVRMSDTLSYYTIERPRGYNPLVEGLIVDKPAGTPRFTGYVLATAPTPDVLLRFNTGEPWLIHSSGASGSGAVLTSGLNTQWSDLAYRGVVVPLLHRLVNDQSRSVSLAPDYIAGRTAIHELPPANIAGNIEVISPDGTRTRGIAKTINGRIGIDLGRLTQPGIWRLMHDNEIVDLIAVNVHPDESDLTSMSVQHFTSATGLPKAIEPKGDLASAVQSARVGTEIGIVFVLLALACMAVEMVLMRGIAPKQPDQAKALSA